MLATLPAAAAASGCASQGGLSVCSFDDGETVADAGVASVSTYFARRDGDGTGDYVVTRDGIRLDGPVAATVEQVDYSYTDTSDDRTIHTQEVRANSGSTSVAVGRTRATYGPVQQCLVYANGVSLPVPCSMLTP